ncbi:MAG: ABC transporter substrate-binding protein [Ilumatobacteraceae bacterium]|nr:ABC transporter substrate-binding protein [Ilumatobacteraceae bacterium]
MIGLVLTGAVLLAACGGDDDSSDSTSVDTSAVEQEAQRIVSLSPTHTEILYAIGAGDQVVAVDSMSNFPADAAITDLSSYEPNVEAIAAFDPDLVVIGDDFTGLADQLAAIGVESWVSSAPVSLDEAYAQIVDLGSAVGRSEAASELADSMKADIEEIIAGAAQLPEGTSYFLELDDTLFSVTSNTFVGSIFDMFGLRNIADATEGDTDYPQLSAEFIVSQDPTLIFLADTKCCGASAETVAARPGWDVLSAVINGHVFGLDDDIASRWGPRLVDFVAAIADALKVAGSE